MRVDFTSRPAVVAISPSCCFKFAPDHSIHKLTLVFPTPVNPSFLKVLIRPWSNKRTAATYVRIVCRGSKSGALIYVEIKSVPGSSVGVDSLIVHINDCPGRRRLCWSHPTIDLCMQSTNRRD